MSHDVAKRGDNAVAMAQGHGSARSAPFLSVEPAANVYETETDYYIVADMPGVAADAVQVIADGSSLAISANAPIARPKEMDEGDDLVRHFERWFTLPDGVDRSAAEAKLSNGVLTLRLPKADNARAHRIAVKAS